ncbi:MAG: peptidoglycan editing factor PgeF [Deltaproteobacteria bacterium]|nr:peptidoglycan editing factor PgeF [Deltaproteobacteria bacterium]
MTGTRAILLKSRGIPAVPGIMPGDLGYPPGVVYFQFEGLAKAGLRHAIFTRLGGVSRSPYDTLNVSNECGDDPEHVKKNLGIVRQVFGTKHLISMKQVHGNQVQVVTEDDVSRLSDPIHADALITPVSQVALMVKLADCQGIILFDPIRRVLANVHCGWRGNVLNIIGIAVERMCATFGSKASEIKAAISPSLGPCCGEFVTHEQIFPEEFRSFMLRKNYFDLWEISRRQLMRAGLRDENIEVAGICTRCRTDFFFSYRAEGITGRFAVLSMLQE